jgi:hypothetical protein
MAEAVRRRSPAWHRDELILALDLFVRLGCLSGGSIPERDDAAVVELSRRMNTLPIWGTEQRAETFRNPNGVVLKLANFRAVERDVSLELGFPGADALPKGMASYGALDRVVFEEFFGRWEVLRSEAASIASALDVASTSLVRDERGRYLLARDAPIDGGGIAEFEAGGGSGGIRQRTEARLVKEFHDYLSDRGHVVTGRHYKVEGEARLLRADLFVKDTATLVEAKASNGRNAIRTAIGQLYDYRRFEEHEPTLAVLVPLAPARDLERLLTGLDIGCVWPHRDGFRDSVGGRLVA